MLLEVAVDLGHIVAVGAGKHDLLVQAALVHLQTLLANMIITKSPDFSN